MSTELVTMGVETTLGAHYSFPDMEKPVAEKLVEALGIETFRRLGQISLVNVSQAVLLVPFRIVKSISIDGKERWHSAV